MARQACEYNFQETLGPLLERRITDRAIALSRDEVDLLKEIDALLNYFEFVLYLEQEGHLRSQDRAALFSYWFELLDEPMRAPVRRYVARFGFERLDRALGAQPYDYVAFYGSLMDGLRPGDAPRFEGRLTNVGRCTLAGDLYDLGDYPGLVAGAGVTLGEVYRVEDPTIFSDLDRFERFDAADRPGSLFLRRLIRLTDPPLDAWVYFLNQWPTGSRIDSGDWRNK